MRQVNGHIIVPADALHAGENAVALDFNAGDVPLNRSDDFLYTIFVPARAHQAFPCFDQPDLKARWSLALDVPEGWQALGNGAEISSADAGAAARASASPEPQPVSTYLFAFAAGKFCVEQAERNGRTFRMFHRETDAAKVARNRDAIFDLHAGALAWLENYTGIPVSVRQVRFPAGPRLPVRRHGASRRDLLQRQRAAARRERDAGPDARPRQRHRARDGAHVVRRSRDDAVVLGCVDEGGLRQPHGGEDREPGVPGA